MASGGRPIEIVKDGRVLKEILTWKKVFEKRFDNWIKFDYDSLTVKEMTISLHIETKRAETLAGTFVSFDTINPRPYNQKWSLSG
jgi:hypothetical protein